MTKSPPTELFKIPHSPESCAIEEQQFTPDNELVLTLRDDIDHKAFVEETKFPSFAKSLIFLY